MFIRGLSHLAYCLPSLLCGCVYSLGRLNHVLLHVDTTFNLCICVLILGWITCFWCHLLLNYIGYRTLFEILTGCGLKGKHGLASVYFQSIKIWCIHSTQLWVPVLCVILGALNTVVHDRHGSSHRGLGVCLGK